MGRLYGLNRRSERGDARGSDDLRDRGVRMRMLPPLALVLLVLPAALAAFVLLLLISLIATIGRRASALLLIRILRIIALALDVRELLDVGTRHRLVVGVVRKKRFSNHSNSELILSVPLKDRLGDALHLRDVQQDHRLKKSGDFDIFGGEPRKRVGDDVDLGIRVLTAIELGVQRCLEIPKEIGALNAAVLLMKVTLKRLGGGEIRARDAALDIRRKAQFNAALRLRVIALPRVDRLLVGDHTIIAGDGRGTFLIHDVGETIGLKP